MENIDVILKAAKCKQITGDNEGQNSKPNYHGLCRKLADRYAMHAIFEDDGLRLFFFINANPE